MITQLSIVVISMVCNKMLAVYGANSEYGANDPLAVIGICMKVFTIVLSIATGIIIGAQPILGYNIGAGQFDRVRETFRKCLTTTIIVGLIATFVFEVCRRIYLATINTCSNNVATVSGPTPPTLGVIAVKSFRSRTTSSTSPTKNPPSLAVPASTTTAPVFTI